MITNTETERRLRQAAVWQALEIKRVQAARKVDCAVDRLWSVRINSNGFKRTRNAKIIQVKGVDCYV